MDLSENRVLVSIQIDHMARREGIPHSQKQPTHINLVVNPIEPHSCPQVPSIPVTAVALYQLQVLSHSIDGMYNTIYNWYTAITLPSTKLQMKC